MHHPIVQRLTALGALLIVLLAGGCARQPPQQNALSGIRLRVTMRFNNPINPSNYYFFLMNLADATGSPKITGDVNAPGPVPVGTPIPGQPYGNGFATGSDSGSTGGFTDFVLFSNNQYGGQQQQGFGLYHVGDLNTGGANNRANFVPQRPPISVTPPSGDLNLPDARVLQFDLDLSQLVTDSHGAPLVDSSVAIAQARTITYIQMNIIATNITPTDAQTMVIKAFDSMGNTSDGRGTFVTLKVSDRHAGSDLTPEPTGDVYVTNGGSAGQFPDLDLVSWSVDVINTQ